MQSVLSLLFCVEKVASVRSQTEKRRNAAHCLTIPEPFRDPVKASALYSQLQRKIRTVRHAHLREFFPVHVPRRLVRQKFVKKIAP